MNKKPVKKPKKQPKLTQKQKQKQSVRVVVNVGGEKPKRQIRFSPEIPMYAPPNIITRPGLTYTQEFQPTTPAQPRMPPTPMRETNYFGRPRREPSVFEPETVDSSTVEFLPDTQDEIINQYLDDPYAVVEGIVDNFNVLSNRTDYIQTQPPSLNMSVINPLPNNSIEPMNLDSIYNVNEDFISPTEDFSSPNEDFISRYITVSTPSTPRIMTPFPLYEETRNNLNRYNYTYSSLRQLPVETITDMMIENNLSILTDTGRKKTKEMMIQSLRANVKKNKKL